MVLVVVVVVDDDDASGVVVGLSVPGNSDLSSTYRPISSIIGWTYVIAWTIRLVSVARCLSLILLF